MKRLGNPAFNRLGVRGVPWGFGSGGSKSYIQKILTPNPGIGYDPSSLIQFLTQNELTGAISYDHSVEINNGAYTGVTLGQPGVPGTGMTSPFFDGAADYNNGFSAGLAADVDKDELTIGIWGRVNAVGDWTDAVGRELFRLRFTGGSGYLRAYKSGAAGQIVIVRYEGPIGGGSQTITWATGSPTDFFSFFVVQSVAGDFLRAFDNDGVQIGADQVGLLTYEGAALDQLWIGSSSGAPGNPWIGYLGPEMFYSDDLPSAVMPYLSTV